jgi:alkane 1-monooxygenase
MKTYTIEHPQDGLIQYQDKKRYLWLTSLFFPFLLPLTGVLSFIQTRQEWTLVIPLIISYGVIPLFDWLVGEDNNNPPEVLVEQLEADRYYKVITYLTVPMHIVTLFVGAWFVGSYPLSIFGIIIIAVVYGLSNGFAINTAHELGHRHKKSLSYQLAKVSLAITFYGHFTIEHNRGHHRWVATPEDNASSQLGESIYQFAVRELWGTFVRGINFEKARLKKQGKSFWTPQNNVLQSYALSLVMQGSLVLIFGGSIIIFLVIHNFFAWFQLTSANYIQHYGLLREKTKKNRYESCKPHHSWNSNHIVSNLTLFNLERHSDHHANPTRSYQSLRNFEKVPRLPNGYFGMYLLAYFPHLWFKVMDHLVLNLPHIDGDLAKVNIYPSKIEYYQNFDHTQST